MYSFLTQYCFLYYYIAEDEDERREKKRCTKEMLPVCNIYIFLIHIGLLLREVMMNE